MADLDLIKLMAPYLQHHIGCEPAPHWEKKHKDKEKNVWVKPRKCSCGLIEIQQQIEEE